MTADHIVIIGAGQGGLQAAISLRQEGHEGAITLIGNEPGLPYQRPPLSKVYLKDGNPDALTLRPQSFFETKSVHYLAQTHVEEINREAKTLKTSKGQVNYDHLIIATGTRNFQPPIAGLEYTFGLRTLADTQAIREKLFNNIQKVAVIGGGFIGLEFASVARDFGLDVTVIEGANRLMERAVSADISERFLNLHREEMGTNISLGQAVTVVTNLGVELADGTFVEAQMVLLATGVRPNCEIAERAGLNIDNGIAVDDYLLTNDPNISSLGDVASFKCPQKNRRVRLESVQAATDHARHIARRIVHGEKTPYNALAWFWSDQGAYKLQIAGRSDPEDDAVRMTDDIVFRFCDGNLVAVETLNVPRVHMKARKALGLGEPINMDQAQELLT